MKKETARERERKGTQIEGASSFGENVLINKRVIWLHFFCCTRPDLVFSFSFVKKIRAKAKTGIKSLSKNGIDFSPERRHKREK